jgi:hypothetical protein
MAKKSAKIIEIKEMMGETGLIIIIEHVGIDPLIELREELETLEDTRFEPYVELSLGFEEQIETLFKLLNAQAIQNLLLPRTG